MNLFVCLWNAPEAWRKAATDAVKRMADVLPQLSADSARRVYPQCDDVADAGSHPVVATIQTAEAALGKRTYVAMDGPDLVLYDGAPVDPDGQIAGWSASALAECWEAAQNRLEGQFVLVRATPRSLQVLTDPLWPLPGVLLAAGSDMAGQQQHRSPSLHYGGTELGSARPQHGRRLRLGGGRPHAHGEHPGNARRRGLERGLRRGRRDQASLLRTR